MTANQKKTPATCAMREYADFFTALEGKHGHGFTEWLKTRLEGQGSPREATADHSAIEDLSRLTGQLFALIAVSSGEEFREWNEDIRQHYTWVMQDAATKARKIVENL